MSAEGFEKTRIQNSDEAHKEANMIRFEAQPFYTNERPKSVDYDKALAALENLRKDAQKESPIIDAMARPIKNLMSTIHAEGAAGELLGWALVVGSGTIANALNTYSDEDLKKAKKEFHKRLEELPADYERDYQFYLTELSSARQRLEKWKAEAEEFAKKQETAEEFNKRQAEQK